VLGATPAAIAGALLSPAIGGSKLLIVSGFVFTIVGVRVIRPIAETLQASGTILVVHAALGHINWTVAGAFSLGAVPASFLSGRLAQRVASSALRKTFGWFLVVSGFAFVLYRVLGA
jgi:hypothetical protein